MTSDTIGATAVAAAPDAASEEKIAAAARHRARIRKIQINTVRVLLAIALVGGWQLAAHLKIVDTFFFGDPSGAAGRLHDWFTKGSDATEFGSIWLQIGVTMKEALFGFVYGVLGGVVTGVLLGRVPFIASVVGPYIKVFNAIPRIVLGAIFTIWLGFGTSSKVLLASVLVFFVVFFNAFQGVREVDRHLIANARVLGASRWQVTRHVVLPSALTWITASLHVAFGFAIIGAIVGEYTGAQYGLGLVIKSAQGNFDPNGVVAAMVIIAVVTLTAEAILGLAEKRLLRWRPPSPAETHGM